MTASAALLLLLATVKLNEVTVIENLGEQVPPDLTFTNSEGEQVALSSLLGTEHRPIVLTLVYYRCPALCGLVLNGLVGSLSKTGFLPGEDYSLITVSIDPTETPADSAEKKRGHLQALGYPARSDAWTFLTGDEQSIRTLANTLGFHYAYDDELKQYAHSAVMFVLTPDGKISRYVYGVQFPPRDLRMALVEAAGGKVGTAFDRILLTCYRYDPVSRRYDLYIKGFLRGGALLVFFALGGFLTVLWRRELKRGAR